MCSGKIVVYARGINGWCGYLCEEHRWLKSFNIQRPVTEKEISRHCEHDMTGEERLLAIKCWESAQAERTNTGTRRA